VFFVACASLIPLAKAMGDATEGLAERMGPTAGSLLNATFGNAAELILGIAALRHGHVELVKGSITGSILANLLLVGGGSIVTGGIRFPRLRFNRLAASSSVATLFLAVVAMVVPTLLSLGKNPRYDPALLSEEICAVLIAMYALSLWFTLRTHREEVSSVRDELLATPAEAAAAKQNVRTGHRPLAFELGRLLVAAGATAIASELLVDALGGTVTAATWTWRWGSPGNRRSKSRCWSPLCW
jgi:calcium/proton exchanger cax